MGTAKSRRNLRSVLLSVLLAALVSQPAASLGITHVAASSVVCDATPRSYENISALLGAPPAATPPATTGGDTLENGAPATEAEREAMRNLVEVWLSCQNEGKLFSAWALFSDAYLYRLISRQPPLTAALYDDWATPQPADTITATLLEISGERRLDDGRLGATVRISYASVPMPKQFFFYFMAQDGTLVIDSILGEISFSVP